MTKRYANGSKRKKTKATYDHPYRPSCLHSFSSGKPTDPKDPFKTTGELTNGRSKIGTHFVTKQQFVAGLDLSQLGVEFLACGKVSFFRSRESFSQVGSIIV